MDQLVHTTIEGLNIALKDTASCKDVYANLFRNMGKVKADVTCKWACAYVAP